MRHVPLILRAVYTEIVQQHGVATILYYRAVDTQYTAI